MGTDTGGMGAGGIGRHFVILILAGLTLLLAAGCEDVELNWRPEPQPQPRPVGRPVGRVVDQSAEPAATQTAPASSKSDSIATAGPSAAQRPPGRR